jgi:deazaflavin-dependent oxidoreductase (nitroreductase family)
MTSTRPSWFVQKVANPLFSSLGMATKLTVKGRKSGTERSVPVNVLETDSGRYLISPRGETDWVLNLRAAGGGELSHKKSNERFTAVEIPTEERPELIAAYREKWDKQVKKLFEALPDPADHPTFKIEPVK